jgi:hypothetical protein
MNSTHFLEQLETYRHGINHVGCTTLGESDRLSQQLELNASREKR